MGGGVGINSHPVGSGIRLQQQRQNESLHHQVTFSEAPNYKIIYLVALIIVTLLLISLIVIIVVLLATKRGNFLYFLLSNLTVKYSQNLAKIGSFYQNFLRIEEKSGVSGNSFHLLNFTIVSTRLYHSPR
ncbi:unnamed protein product [Meloidogyne enterolobii]|uniref:Uncharacterized protein n=1 Tax=Meloidogyne enterolobii TaxID=390850 RepID=A0ACB0YCB5_MELEN